MEVRGHSASYETLAAQIAADTQLLALIDRLPASKRQPNLLLGAVRFLGGPVSVDRVPGVLRRNRAIAALPLDLQRGPPRPGVRA
nr:DUF2332 family protein [Streptomyces sp. 846.5]